MDDGMRRAFLRFATGSDRVPLLGAHALQLKITVLHAHPERYQASPARHAFISILTCLCGQAACGAHVLQPGVSVWIHVQEHAAGQACPGHHRVRRLRSCLTLHDSIYYYFTCIRWWFVSELKQTSRREHHECTPINNTYRGNRQLLQVEVVVVVVLDHIENLSIFARM
jgi:hypothetical protein